MVYYFNYILFFFHRTNIFSLFKIWLIYKNQPESYLNHGLLEFWMVILIQRWLNFLLSNFHIYRFITALVFEDIFNNWLVSCYFLALAISIYLWRDLWILVYRLTQKTDKHTHKHINDPINRQQKSPTELGKSVISSLLKVSAYVTSYVAQVYSLNIMKCTTGREALTS